MTQTYDTPDASVAPRSLAATSGGANEIPQKRRGFKLILLLYFFYIYFFLAKNKAEK